LDLKIDIPTKGRDRLLSETTSEQTPVVNSGPAIIQQQSSVFLSVPIQQSGESETAVSDVTLQNDASKRLSEDPDLTSITVTITEARAVLTGTVTSAAARAKAEKLIRAVPGVKSVDNKIKVSGG